MWALAKDVSTAFGDIKSSPDNAHLMHSRLAVQELGPHLTSPILIGFGGLHMLPSISASRKGERNCDRDIALRRYAFSAA
jgi:hypothetical protein